MLGLSGRQGLCVGTPPCSFCLPSHLAQERCCCAAALTVKRAADSPRALLVAAPGEVGALIHLRQTRQAAAASSPGSATACAAARQGDRRLRAHRLEWWAVPAVAEPRAPSLAVRGLLGGTGGRRTRQEHESEGPHGAAVCKE